jgi:hypothetical protein
MINFVVVGVPLIIITVYSSVINISNHIKNIKVFEKSISQANEYIQVYFPLSDKDKESMKEQMLNSFQGLSENILEDFTRYSIFFLGIFFLLIFEVSLAKYTLTKKAIEFTLLDYSLALVATIILFGVGIKKYQIILKNACNLLVKLEINYQDFQNKHNVISLLSLAISRASRKRYAYIFLFAIILSLSIFLR